MTAIAGQTAGPNFSFKFLKNFTGNVGLVCYLVIFVLNHFQLSDFDSF